MYDRVKFFRRRQFVLGPEYIDYEGWRRIKVEDRYLLTVHPDLAVTSVEEQQNKAVLLGYAIDPYQPELNDEDILKRFVATLQSVQVVCTGLETLSGRFVLIVKNGGNLWLFHDACGLRQVNYCMDHRGSIWCASQPETLAERFDYKLDDEILSYRESPAYSSSKEEFWLINDRTPYREIKYLLPNHYIDLRQGRVNRFWPVAGCIGSLSMAESIQLCTPIIQNSIKRASQRFELKFGISAGSDSRRSLAATKAIKENIYFFTHTPRTANKADMEIPARLLPRLGINHHKINLQIMNEEFRMLYESSATWARERRGNIAYTLLNHFGPNATVLNSNISEVHQCWYWLPRSKIDGEGLAVLTKLNHKLPIKEFQKWLDGAKSACEISKMNILLLFDYELRSRWVAAAFSEYDIAHETFNPYNNRHLFKLELSVNERYRRSRQLNFIIKQIIYMWPEVLIEPINPPQYLSKKIQNIILQYFIHKAITPWLPVYDYLRYIKMRWLFKKNGNK